ncbi:class I SAM-dependent methyltransferase [Methylosinus sp. H3A]|uniref:class I SAM-dependent methyltransferase n=1 Tax=Methylosinus sp. H3A TaxID=2785786 RepID=UPI0018C2FAA6|nr:class I SAM-dependent methyltransferase [Methylosinus sp. H3A]MBG0812425.1 class I SAM-dependent methyltransferase [Methylosinus sp. H3A]
MESESWNSKRAHSMSEPATARPTVSTHYDAAYFEWQKDGGQFGGWANIDKFRKSIEPASRVLDLGCGGGFLLANLECAERFAIEPNATARETAVSNGVRAFANAAEALAAIGQESIDVVISDNALEHALEPWQELRALKPLLKPGGKLHIVVPCENISWGYKTKDINQHVYSWSPQSIGNLLKAAGYEVEYSRPYIHKWPPRMSRQLARLGRPVFNFCCRVWGQLDRRWFQIEAMATRPMSDHD